VHEVTGAVVAHTKRVKIRLWRLDAFVLL